jgi:hypothetical protein
MTLSLCVVAYGLFGLRRASMKLCKLGKELRGELSGELEELDEELDEDFLRVRDLERGDDIYYIYLFFE